MSFISRDISLNFCNSLKSNHWKFANLANHQKPTQAWKVSRCDQSSRALVYSKQPTATDRLSAIMWHKKFSHLIITLSFQKFDFKWIDFIDLNGGQCLMQFIAQSLKVFLSLINSLPLPGHLNTTWVGFSMATPMRGQIIEIIYWQIL